jgi:choline dehydrogenase-like flavoprotein
MSSYDVIVIGSGAGGGTLVRQLAGSGKRVLLLERGDWLAREPQNWQSHDVFVDNRYVSQDTWYDERDRPFQPQVHYFVGGATKLYGAALYRLRAEDFGALRHHDGISPAWPISYAEMEPFYTRAEDVYQVHGARGEDPTEPPASAPYPFPAVSHEPNPTVFQKTLGVNTYYFATKGIDFPLGNIQMVGKSSAEMYRGEKPLQTKLAPEWTLGSVAKHAVDFWLSTEDLPRPDNRVTLRADGSVALRYAPSNDVPKQRLLHELKSMVKHLGMHHDHLLERLGASQRTAESAHVA